LRRPKPDLQALHMPRPELKSIVTHPPIFGGGGGEGPAVPPV
jgi:amidase